MWGLEDILAAWGLDDTLAAIGIVVGVIAAVAAVGAWVIGVSAKRATERMEALEQTRRVEELERAKSARIVPTLKTKSPHFVYLCLYNDGPATAHDVEAEVHLVGGGPVAYSAGDALPLAALTPGQETSVRVTSPIFGVSEETAFFDIVVRWTDGTGRAETTHYVGKSESR